MADNKRHNILEAALAQEKYCDRHGFLQFAPSDGRCWKCSENIYNDKGYSVDLAGSHVITGCPHCNASFCD